MQRLIADWRSHTLGKFFRGPSLKDGDLYEEGDSRAAQALVSPLLAQTFLLNQEVFEYLFF